MALQEGLPSPHLCEVVVVRRTCEMQPAQIRWRQAHQHAVEDVVVPLSILLVDQTRFLQQILLNLGTLDDSSVSEVDVNVLAKTGGVVVADGFGIAKSCGRRNHNKSTHRPHMAASLGPRAHI